MVHTSPHRLLQVLVVRSASKEREDGLQSVTTIEEVLSSLLNSAEDPIFTDMIRD